MCEGWKQGEMFYQDNIRPQSPCKKQRFKDTRESYTSLKYLIQHEKKNQMMVSRLKMR